MFRGKSFLILSPLDNPLSEVAPHASVACATLERNSLARIDSPEGGPNKPCRMSSYRPAVAKPRRMNTYKSLSCNLNGMNTYRKKGEGVGRLLLPAL